MKLKALVTAAVVTTLALAGCSVDHSGQDASKPTIRIGYQSFPSGDLIVKNNKWLEEALPDFNIKQRHRAGEDFKPLVVAGRPHEPKAQGAGRGRRVPRAHGVKG